MVKLFTFLFLGKLFTLFHYHQFSHFLTHLPLVFLTLHYGSKPMFMPIYFSFPKLLEIPTSTHVPS